MPNAAHSKVPLITSATVLIGAALAVIPMTSLLAFDRDAILGGELWRLWTGHLVHFSTRQLVIDMGSLFLVGCIAEKEFGSRFTAVVLLLAMPAISLGLLLTEPGLTHYRGASGIAMVLALMAATTLWHQRPKLRTILAIIGLTLTCKSMLDAAGLLPQASNLPEGIQVAWSAHVLGAAIGWLAAHLKLRKIAAEGQTKALQAPR